MASSPEAPAARPAATGSATPSAQRPGQPRARRRGRPSKARGLAPAAAPADRFAALADATRRHLIEQLATADRAVGELVAGLDISQAAVSQHLRVLRDAGLVTARKEGRCRYYRLRPAALTELRDWLDELEQFWQARLAALGEYLGEQLAEATAWQVREQLGESPVTR
jgi:DNA-binding transcriptional ArsR family regulator